MRFDLESLEQTKVHPPAKRFQNDDLVVASRAAREAA
jgi:hypothetical protein